CFTESSFTDGPGPAASAPLSTDVLGLRVLRGDLRPLSERGCSVGITVGLVTAANTTKGPLRERQLVPHAPARAAATRARVEATGNVKRSPTPRRLVLQHGGELSPGT